MPIGSNDLGQVADTTNDLLADVKLLGAELRRVNAEIEKVARKNQTLSPELEKKRRDLEALHARASGQLLQNSTKALLSPQASREVQAEARKVIAAELKDIQTKIARSVLSGGRVDQSLVGRQAQLQTVLATPTRATTPAPRESLTEKAYAMRGRVRQTYGLARNLASGQFNWNDAMDIGDAAELGSAGFGYAGNVLKNVGGAGRLGRMGGALARAGGALGNAAAFMSTPGGALATGGLLSGVMFEMQVLENIREKSQVKVDSFTGAQKLTQALWGKDRARELGDLLMGSNAGVSAGQTLTAAQAATFTAIAKAAGNEDFKLDWTASNFLGDAETHRSYGVQHLTKIFGEAEQNYNLYLDAAKRTTKKIDGTTAATITESLINEMKGGDKHIVVRVAEKLKEYTDIDKAQELYDRTELSKNKQLRWKIRYQERALAELEKETLLARQDWSRK